MTQNYWEHRRFTEENKRRKDHRTPYQRDRARVLHSAAFRRLQAKTQVLGIGMNDFYRTRLTHSLEVSQIGTGVISQLKDKYPNLDHLLCSDSLMETICLSHDIGHPPFGHGGETALNYMMRNYGGFEGNGQTFRILTCLEPYTPDYGMNLTRRTLLGVLKYPAAYHTLFQQYQLEEVINYRQLKPIDWPVVKGIYHHDRATLDWVLSPLSHEDRERFLTPAVVEGQHHKRTQYKSLDCSVMELADDIAYAVHDLEDAIVMGIVKPEHWNENVKQTISTLDNQWIRSEILNLSEKLFATEHHIRKNAIGTLVNSLVTSINIEIDDNFDEPLLKYNAVMQPDYYQVLNALKQLVYKWVIRRPEIQMLEFKGQQIVMELFEAIASDPERLLPYSTQEKWKACIEKHGCGMRVISDYISGMTDDFAGRLYQQLFSPKSGAIIEIGPH
ncbi:deoxyguanosinetriphosphate triphosphohydrolase family protein [Shewanella sp. 202IG2-18]|uniref:anti-phage deoxyguanosine triphosphatase n=1 Tax=Parashewanella hymeniacidonis TaxID=2807618 RepID=UPI0019601051|nr:anti-phage deoxyguanosine triphosphatase [Parashewanella hymeniacidonis]MBM7071341.1 deoxyguanosinetriphosphate triphosphohydrolase family protein [Parashewanella hymeniacidonis]